MDRHNMYYYWVYRSPSSVNTSSDSEDDLQNDDRLIATAYYQEHRNIYIISFVDNPLNSLNEEQNLRIYRILTTAIDTLTHRVRDFDAEADVLLVNAEKNVQFVLKSSPSPPTSPCNHLFHVNCVREWFKRNQSCPMCRVSIIQA